MILEMLLPLLPKYSYLSLVQRRENIKSNIDVGNAIATTANKPTLSWYGIRGFGEFEQFAKFENFEKFAIFAQRIWSA
jgi:hypothetical protein